MNIEGIRRICLARHLFELGTGSLRDHLDGRQLSTVCGYNYVIGYDDWKRRFDAGPLFGGYWGSGCLSVTGGKRTGRPWVYRLPPGL